MANRTIYVPDEALPVYARAQELAAWHGRSVSDLISALLALYVRVVDYGPSAPAGVEVYRAARKRASAAFAGLEPHSGECDRCAGPAGVVRLSFDLTQAGAPMTISRFCEGCAAREPVSS